MNFFHPKRVRCILDSGKPTLYNGAPNKTPDRSA
jgi:hypothetical protein